MIMPEDRGTAVEFSSIQGRISHIAGIMPDKTSIAQGGRRISYSELENLSDRVAAFLGGNIGIHKNVVVYMEKSFELVSTVLGILKSGCIFVPFDPCFPDKRQKVLMEMIRPEWVITTVKHLDALDRIASIAGFQFNVILEEMKAEVLESYCNLKVFSLKGYDGVLPESSGDIKNKHSYIYFTSGSTGQPKGILGRHRSLKHFIDWETEEFGINSDFNISQLTPPTFDPFLRDIFVPLCSGATVHIPDNVNIPVDARKTADWLEENQITLIHTVPSIFKNLITEIKDSESLKHLKYILLAGEMLRGNDIKPFMEVFGDRIQLVNLYGPTETTLAKLFYRVRKEDASKIRIPVGKPISYTDALILDNDLNKCQVESIGEIYIRTPFISSGYINGKEMTAKVFLRNPFSDNPQDIIYKTGDLGKINPDGNIELVGRMDHQVKIRGVRIELTEIESALLENECIHNAVVIAKEDENNEKTLCAYYVEKEKTSAVELRSYIKKLLPEHMIPSCFIRLDKLPLNSNGKIDRGALPEPEKGDYSEKEYIAPRDDKERKLVDLWENVLKKAGIGIEDDFFDMGGHSLRAAALVSAINRSLGIQLSIKDVFKYPTVNEMAKYVESLGPAGQSPIEHVEERESYPVSPSQKRLYILNRLDGDSIRYNMPFAMIIEGEFDQERFDKAVHKIINRHEILRMSFGMDGGTVVQKVAKDIDFKVFYTEFREEELEKQFDAFVKPFCLDTPPLIRVCLAKMGTSKHLAMFDMHHIISDGTSITILISEFVHLYGTDNAIQEPAYQYRDYTGWQNKLLNSGSIKQQEEYWLRVFSDEIPVLNMPADYPRPTIQSFEGNSIVFEMDGGLTERIGALAKKESATIYMFLLAALNTLLMKYSGQEDIVVGSPVSGRKHVEFENLVGMFINTLALRNKPEHGKTFREFLYEVRQNAMDAFDNSDYQFEELVEGLNVQRDFSRNPLFDVMFALHNFERGEFEIEGLKIREYRHDHHVSKFDIVLTAYEAEGKIIFDLKYCTNIFHESTMERFIQHFLNILREVSNNPDIRLSDINILSSLEKEQIMYGFNNTDSEFPECKTINGLFLEQAEKTPDNTAVICEGERLTYRQLNARANRLAWVLRERGVVPDSIVAIMCRRSIEMVIGIMGILKAGGAYLPIDPGYPAERIKYVLGDSSAAVLLMQDRNVVQVDWGRNIVYLDGDEACSMDVSEIDIVNGPENLAYVIYTSGSTGNPKGVMIEHRSLINRLNWMQKKYPIGQNDVILQKTPYTFDVSVWELLWWSLQGAAVCMLVQGGEKNPETIIEAIEKNSITTMHFVPSMLKSFLSYVEEGQHTERLKSLRQVFASGEALTPGQVNKFYHLIYGRLGTTLHNLYGPTEAAIDVSYFDCSTEDKLDAVPIGRPIDNIKLFILDKNFCLQPVGVPGELHISGVGLARGYLNRPSLTQERFMASPFPEVERIYRTGDVAKWLPDGNIEYLGRADHQVKIRGNRIEPGEIEEVLKKNEMVADAVVIPKEDKSGNKYLCAYIETDSEFTIPEIKMYLGKILPDYMIPSNFVRLDKLPLSSNGKIDRKALPEPHENLSTGVEYVAPRNEAEKIITDLWKEVLEIDTVGMEDNFFDLGGNSLRLVELYSKLEKAYPGRLKVADLFTYTKVSQIAAFLYAGQSLRKKMELGTVALPQEYFIDKDDVNSDCLMYLTIDDATYGKIKSIAEQNNVQAFSSLLAAYMYLLSDISSESEVSVATLNDDCSALLFMETNMNEADNLNELFKMVDMNYMDKTIKGGYPIHQLEKEILHKDSRETYSMMYKDEAEFSITRDIFDLKLGMTEGKDGCLRLSCEYNARRLKKDKVEILLNAYAKLLKIIADSM
jgi:amino acid adenylation domain-containing protein